MMASRRRYVLTKYKIKSIIRRSNPKTIRLSWLRAARGRTNVERAEKRVRITVNNPNTKTRIWIRLSEVDMGGIIKQELCHWSLQFVKQSLRNRFDRGDFVYCTYFANSSSNCSCLV